VGEGALTRQQVLHRFRTDDEALVRGVLRDLVDSGVLACSGHGANATFWAVSREQLEGRWPGTSEQGLEELLWAIVYRGGPIGVETLAERLPLAEQHLQPLLDRMVASGRLERAPDGYRASDFSVPLNSPVGWEAAVFDHVQAMVQTICQRLRIGAAVPSGTEMVGGSTYSFDIWDGHPFAEEVEAALSRFRAQHTELRERVDAWNRDHGRPPDYRQVVVYGGQCVLERESGSPADATDEREDEDE
jgi:hypothetical protein